MEFSQLQKKALGHMELIYDPVLGGLANVLQGMLLQMEIYIRNCQPLCIICWSRGPI